MAVSAAAFRRMTMLLVLIGLVALFVVAGMSLWLGQRTQSFFDEVLQARDARVATVDLRSRLQDIEIGQRGYLLTGDESYLAPYLNARDKVLPAYDVVLDKVTFLPEFHQQLIDLRETLQQKLDEIAQTVDLAREGRRDEAVALVATGRGKELMDETRAVLGEVILASDRRLVEGTEQQRTASAWQRGTTMAAVLVIVGVSAGAVRLAQSYTKDLIAARRQVETLAAGLEERVKERTLDLRRANDEIQRFAYIVTHDLRAPLVNIMGFTSELEEGLATVRAAEESRERDEAGNEPLQDQAKLVLTEDLPEAIGFIRSSTQKMDALINAILKLSREGRRPLKPETIDLEELLTESAAAVQHQVTEADGQIDLEIEARSIVSDRLALGQMIGNLLDNAIKYRRRDKPLELLLRTRTAPGRRIIIEVEDNGRGIQAEDHQRVFELFRRSGTQDVAGEGIGLPHVRGMARTMGGDVTVRSFLGQGATFTIVLPNDLRTVLEAAGQIETEGV